MIDWPNMLERLAAAAIVAAGLWLMYCGLVRLFFRNPELAWKPVEGEICASGVEEHTDSDENRTYYNAKVQYAYEFRGVKFLNERVAPLQFPVQSPSRWGSESLVRRYPRGRRVTVFVNPRNPGKSVLEPGRQIYAAVCCILIGVGACAIAFSMIRTH